MQLPVFIVRREQLLVVMDLLARQDLFDLIVENIGFVVDIDGENAVRDAEVFVLHDNDAHLVQGKPDGAQRHVFGDGVILAIAVLRSELRGC